MDENRENPIIYESSSFKILSHTLHEKNDGDSFYFLLFPDLESKT